MIAPTTIGAGPGAFVTQRLDAGADRAARTLLCLHPLGQQARFFSPLADHLDGSWRVVSFDQRGHGAAAGQPPESLAQMVADAAAFGDQLSGSVHLLGHSMGGAVAADLAAARPGAFASLTIVATPPRGMPVFAERAVAAEAGTLDTVMQPTIARWFGTSGDDTAIATARAALSQMTPRGFDAAWHALASFGGFERIANDLPPTLVVSFADDLSTPPPVLDAIAATIADAGVSVRRVDIEGAGHMGLLQKPRALAEAIAAFAEQIAEKGAAS